MKKLTSKTLVAAAFVASSLSMGTAATATDVASLDAKNMQPQSWEWLCRQIPLTCKEH